MNYKSGSSNCDADCLSRRPHEALELLSNVVKAICETYTVQRGSCPYAETRVFASASQLAESVDSNLESLDSDDQKIMESTDINTVDWVKEQSEGDCVGIIVHYVKSGYCPQKEELLEFPDSVKYFRHWKNFYLVDHVLYRNTIIDGEKVQQLVLPVAFRDLVLNTFTTMLAT